MDQANCQANLRPRCEARRKDSVQSKDPAQAWIQEKTKNKERKKEKEKEPKIQSNGDEVCKETKLKSINSFTVNVVGFRVQISNCIVVVGLLICSPT